MKTVQTLNWYDKKTGVLLYLYGLLNHTMVYPDEGRVVKEVIFSELSNPNFTLPLNPLETILSNNSSSSEFLSLKSWPIIIGLSLFLIGVIKKERY